MRMQYTKYVHCVHILMCDVKKYKVYEDVHIDRVRVIYIYTLYIGLNTGKNMRITILLMHQKAVKRGGVNERP